MGYMGLNDTTMKGRAMPNQAKIALAIHTSSILIAVSKIMDLKFEDPLVRARVNDEMGNILEVTNTLNQIEQDLPL